MKRAGVIAVLILSSVIAGCRSGSSSTPSARLLEPEVMLVQTAGPAQNSYASGLTMVRFEFYVKNHSSEPIRLRQLDLRSVGDAAYVLETIPHFFNKEFAPEQTDKVEFTSRANARGGVIESGVPVTVRGVAYFETPTGKLNKIFTQNIAQVSSAQPR